MAVRSGFVGRSMLRNFGPLSVSFGLGGFDGELIFGPEPPTLIDFEPDVLIAAVAVGAPKTVLFVSRDMMRQCPQLLRPYEPPPGVPAARVLIERSQKEEAARPSMRVEARSAPGPKVSVGAGSKKPKKRRGPRRPKEPIPKDRAPSVKVTATKPPKKKG